MNAASGFIRCGSADAFHRPAAAGRPAMTSPDDYFFGAAHASHAGLRDGIASALKNIAASGHYRRGHLPRDRLRPSRKASLLANKRSLRSYCLARNRRVLSYSPIIMRLASRLR